MTISWSSVQWIECDVDGCTMDGEFEGRATRDIRRDLHKVGWRYFNGKDYCPDHEEVFLLAKIAHGQASAKAKRERRRAS